MRLWPTRAPRTAGALVRDLRKEMFPFARAERYIAAVCMGTPFFLILADQWQARSAWILIPLLAFVPVLPTLTAYVAIKLRTGDESTHATHAFITAALMLGVLLVLAFVFNGWFRLDVRPTISDYVDMDAAHIFGLLLTMASMLFLTNGLVYMNRAGRGAFARHGYNIGLGIALLFVVLLPVTTPAVHVFHFVAAGIFFIGSAVCIAVFCEPRHQQSSRLIAGLMLLGFVLHFLNLRLESPLLAWLTLFWAETLGLWVIGIHYILESLGELT